MNTIEQPWVNPNEEEQLLRAKMQNMGYSPLEINDFVLSQRAAKLGIGSAPTGGWSGSRGLESLLAPGRAPGGAPAGLMPPLGMPPRVGYTGPGGKYQPAGVVHAGEEVFDKPVVDEVGVAPMEKFRMNVKQGKPATLSYPGRGGAAAIGGLPGYAEGGPVLPPRPKGLQSSGGLDRVYASTAPLPKRLLGYPPGYEPKKGDIPPPFNQGVGGLAAGANLVSPDALALALAGGRDKFYDPYNPNDIGGAAARARNDASRIKANAAQAQAALNAPAASSQNFGGRGNYYDLHPEVERPMLPGERGVTRGGGVPAPYAPRPSAGGGGVPQVDRATLNAMLEAKLKAKVVSPFVSWEPPAASSVQGAAPYLPWVPPSASQPKVNFGSPEHLALIRAQNGGLPGYAEGGLVAPPPEEEDPRNNQQLFAAKQMLLDAAGKVPGRSYTRETLARARPAEILAEASLLQRRLEDAATSGALAEPPASARNELPSIYGSPPPELPAWGAGNRPPGWGTASFTLPDGSTRVYGDAPGQSAFPDAQGYGTHNLPATPDMQAAAMRPPLGLAPPPPVPPGSLPPALDYLRRGGSQPWKAQAIEDGTKPATRSPLAVQSIRETDRSGQVVDNTYDKNTGRLIASAPAFRAFASPEETARGAEASTVAKQAADENGGFRSMAADSSRLIPGIATGMRLIQEGARTGFGANAEVKVKQIAKSLGIDSNVANMEQLNTILGDQLMSRIQQTKGAVSDFENKLFQRISAESGKTPEGNLQILAAYKRKLERDVEIGKIVQQGRRAGASERTINQDVYDYILEKPLFTQEQANGLTSAATPAPNASAFASVMSAITGGGAAAQPQAARPVARSGKFKIVEIK